MKDVIQQKLSEYDCKTSEEEENAIKEITQEVALYALSRTNFFSKASFQGGTCLRIIYGLDRFSEDLDFVLNETNLNFEISPYLDDIIPTMNAYGYDIEISEKDKADSNVRKRFIKDDSIKKIIEFKHYSDTRKKIKVKIELDVNPPQGSIIEQNFIDFPVDFGIGSQNLGSLFAGKCHALLCRKFVKGRDWYDFAWYISKKVIPNYELLGNALKQAGPWEGNDLMVNSNWLREKLKEKINIIDWIEAVDDVTRFLHPEQRESLSLWGKRFFIKKTEKFTNYVIE